MLGTAVDRSRDHVRGGTAADAIIVVLYGDYLCPYCRRLRTVIRRLQQVLGERLTFVYRHFPNEGAHAGAEFFARAAEAAGKQGHFWEMHDWLYDQEPPLNRDGVSAHARALGLDMPRFHRDVDADETRARVEEDRAQGRESGVMGTPTLFIDGLRYDGAWDFYSLLEALDRPAAHRLQRSAHAFANLPASAGLTLLLAGAAALVCANTSLAPYYRLLITSSFVIGPAGHTLSLAIGAWLSEGLLALFFLVVGLEIRREVTAGALADVRVAALPVIAAIGGVVVPAAIYLIFNRGPTAGGWAVPTATDVAFTLGILALLGRRVPTALRVFVAALAVVDDVLSVLTLAIFYAHAFSPRWLLVSALSVVVLLVLNRSRTYAAWPYAVATIALAVSLHAAGVHAALAGVILAVFLPTWPRPAAAPLLAQAATALAELEHAEHDASMASDPLHGIEQQPLWDWASRNLTAASERLLSPADRIERAVAPWTAYVILPLFAFSATGVALDVDIGSSATWPILVGVILGLVLGKPLGIAAASWFAIKTKLALIADDVTPRNFVGAAFLCGVGDTTALLIADQAFTSGSYAAAAKIGILVGSMVAAGIGAAILAWGHGARTMTRFEPEPA
jgi:NhaA family Na+:H+ antiporter